MAEAIQLLVVDGSELLTWMVSRVAPDGVDVTRAATFPQAEKIFATNPPDAAIFNLTPCVPIWRTLIDACAQRTPPIPFLCTSGMDEDADFCRGVPCKPGAFISLDMTPTELARAVGFLIAESRNNRAQ